MFYELSKFLLAKHSTSFGIKQKSSDYTYTVICLQAC